MLKGLLGIFQSFFPNSKWAGALKKWFPRRKAWCWTICLPTVFKSHDLQKAPCASLHQQSFRQGTSSRRSRCSGVKCQSSVSWCNVCCHLPADISLTVDHQQRQSRNTWWDYKEHRAATNESKSCSSDVKQQQHWGDTLCRAAGSQTGLGTVFMRGGHTLLFLRSQPAFPPSVNWSVFFHVNW